MRLASKLIDNLNSEFYLCVQIRSNPPPSDSPNSLPSLSLHNSSLSLYLSSPSHSIFYSPVAFSELSTQPLDSPPSSPSSSFISDFLLFLLESTYAVTSRSWKIYTFILDTYYNTLALYLLSPVFITLILSSFSTYLLWAHWHPFSQLAQVLPSQNYSISYTP